MHKNIFIAFLWLALLWPLCATAQNNAYRQPAADVTNIVLAKPTPQVSINPTDDGMLLTDYNPNPGIATLARPFLKLAGLRVDPQITARQRITEFTGCTVQWFLEGKTVKIEMPKEGHLAGVPRWSPDGRTLAFGMDVADGVQLWVADARTGKSRRLGNFYINELLGNAFQWMKDSERLLVRTVPTTRGIAPPATALPTGPNVEETAGKVSQVVTLQDLLRSEHDEKLFEYYGQSRLAFVNITSGQTTFVGAAGLHMTASPSPDGQYLLVTTLQRPFSYRVAFSNFARKTEIWDKTGKNIRTLATYGITDEIPRQGVVNGPRSFEWQALHGARMVWAEALDGGDPKRKADFRDKVLALGSPFSGEPTELFKTKYRFSGFYWLANKDEALFDDYDRDRRWVTTYHVNLTRPENRDTFFDLSINDDYANPGSPVYTKAANGDYVVMQDGDWLFYDAEGASPEGQFPRLDRINLRTRKKETLFESPKNALEAFVSFVGNDRKRIITRHQSKTEVPNFYLSSLGADAKNRKALTQFTDPAPQLTGIEKRVVKYKRPDGIPLSGTLYLPANYKPGQKLPLFMWAYPLEYSDLKTAGQVRVTDNNFTFYRNDSPLFFVTQGYAVLMDATIPIVGDPETMNNTFVEQATAGGRAAIDYLDSLGIIDRTKVGVGGHSYGAFMTANLLAHSNDYAYGIARSGAYNRTLTPFGFQSERRSFWEAKDIYMNVSPFTHADKIKKPLLLIHGEADNNPGTFTVQSERLFQAIKGNGGTARLVLLPHESHGYRARESVLHVLAEMFDWANKYGGTRP